MAWLSGWAYRKKITIDGTKIDANLTDFPVAVILTSSNFDFSKARSDGTDIRFCYSPDTEILTENGWMLLKDLVEKRLQVKVATLNPNTNKLEYHYPIDYQKIWFKGKLFHQKGRIVDLLVTPEHRMWVKKEWDRRKKRNFQIIRAKDLPKHYYLQVSANWEGEEKKWFILPATIRYNGRRGKEFIRPKKILMDDWLKFFGFWLAEGSCFIDGHAHTITITQKDENILIFLAKLLKKYGFNPSFVKRKDASNLRIINIQLYSYLSQFGKTYEKFIPKEIKNLSKRQLEILFEWLVRGDGHKRGRNIIYFTTSKQLADDISEVALKLGYSCSFKKRLGGTLAFGKYKRKEGYVLSLTKRETIQVNRTDKREWIDYEGFVYDITVPNHIIYVRRNGKSLWSGNCASDGETLLKYERERHDATNQVAEYHVKIPSLTAGQNKSFYLYYGNPDASDGADPTNVWDSNFKGVWHLRNNLNDSTINNNNFNDLGDLSYVDGKIDGGLYKGGNTSIKGASIQNYNLDFSVFTIELWGKRTDRYDVGFGRRCADANSYWSWVLGFDYPANVISFSVNNTNLSGSAMDTNVWYYIVGVFDSSYNLNLYIDGTLVNSVSRGSEVIYSDPSDSSHIVRLLFSGAGQRTYYAYADEVRISNIARPAAWIKASYHSGNNTLLNFGSEEILTSARRRLLLSTF